MTHVENFSSQIVTFSQFYITLNVIYAGKKQMISRLLLNSFYMDEFKRKATNCSIRLGHSLWSANQLPAQGVDSGIVGEKIK